MRAILELRDLVLQHQFALFQALHLELIVGPALHQPPDDVIQVAMLAAQLLQLAAQIRKIVHNRNDTGSGPFGHVVTISL